MGRGRGKGKKHAARDDPTNGEEERQPVLKRRGRPQNPMKDEIDDDEESAKMEGENETVKSSITSKDTEDQAAALDNGRKRKVPSSQVKENSDNTTKEEEDEEIKGAKSKSSADRSIKSVGFRQNGNRRKSKPHRAAEVGVGYK